VEKLIREHRRLYGDFEAIDYVDEAVVGQRTRSAVVHLAPEDGLEGDGQDVRGSAHVDVVAAHGVRSTDEAIAFVADLKKSGRYQQDVY